MKKNSNKKTGLFPVQGKKTNEFVEFKEFKLDNGLNVVLSEDHSIPSVALNVCYHVGSKDEELNKTGYAHLFEHLMFEGSPNIPKGEYELLTNRAGGENNAYTTEDKTNYYLLLPANQLELGFWLESDRMSGCVVNKESLQTQKKVVIEEKRQNFDNRPYGSVSLEFAPRLFPGSSYGWDTIGKIGDIEKAKLDDVKLFFDKYYVPNNAVISLTGSFKTDEVIKHIEKYFGNIKPGNMINRNKKVPKHHGEIKETVFDKIHCPGIFIGYRIPPENSREFFAFEILAEILSGGDSSRLHKKLVYDEQIASETGCWVDAKEFAGVLYLYAVLLPGSKVTAAEDVLNDIIESACNRSVEERELQKAKNRKETKSCFRKQFILTKADMLAHYKTFYDDPGLINTNIKNFLSVTKDEVQIFSQKYLCSQNRVELIYLPDPRSAL
jgi:zinc protease